MSKGASNKKVANGLVVLSSAAVLAVYTAGYARTRSAAERLDAQSAERRPAAHDASRTPSPLADSQPAASNVPADVRSPVESASSIRARDVDGKPKLIASVESVPATARVSSGVAAGIAAPAPDSMTAPSAVETPAPAVEHKTEVAAVAPTEALPPPAAAVPSAPAALSTPPPIPPQPKWKDGLYYGWGTSRHGDIQAAVAIQGGRIASATIAQCLTRYSCDVISRLPPQVAQRQSPETDYVSGATQSTNAFYYAVVEALSKAK